MAVNPSFISTARIGRASLSSANTNTDGTGTITDLITGVAAGTRILEIVTQGTIQTAAGLVNIFTWDGTNWDLFDQVTISAVTGSSTVKGNRVSTVYQNLVLPSATWKLGCTLTVAPTSGTVRVFAFGGDLT